MHIRKYQQLSIAVFLSLIIMIPLRRIHCVYNGDWLNHSWTIQSLANDLLHFGKFSAVVHPPQTLFNPTPVFYGSIFYPLTGFAATLFTAEGALRLFVFVIFTLQFLLVYRAAKAVGYSQGLSISMGVIVNTAIYPLSNLYNRAAVTEFFSTSFLTCSLCSLVVFLNSPKRKVIWAAALALFLSLCAGTHPITALYAPIFFVPMATVLTRRASFTLWPWVIGVGALVILANLPFILGTASLIKVLAKAGDPSVALMEFDSFWTRFSPLPYDARGINLGSKTDTPYIDLQANVPLLFLFLFFVISRRRKFIKNVLDVAALHTPPIVALLIALSLFFAATWLSLSEYPYSHLPKIMQIVQFTYRLISFQNLSLLFAFFALAKTFSSSSEKDAIILTVCLTTAVLSLGTKISRIEPLATYKQILLQDDWSRVPDSFAIGNYTTTDRPEISEASLRKESTALLSLNFSLDSGSATQTLPLPIHANEDGYYKTNLTRFAWIEIRDNDSVVDTNQIYKGDFNTVVKLSKGDHKLRAFWSPPRFWEVSRLISFGILAVLLGACFYGAICLLL